jgi:phage-related protein
MRRSVIFYRTEKGQCPVSEFLDSIPSKVAQKVTWVLKLIQELDTVPRQYLKKLSDTEEIWECRMVFGGNTYRILGFFNAGNQMILTHGFIKKTDKTPADEITRAERLKADHIRRYGNA